MLNCSVSIKTFKTEHIPQYPKVLIHFINTSSDLVLLHYLLTMKNSCHVGVEVDMFYKLAFFFFFFLKKRLFLSRTLLQPEAYRKFILCDCVESFTQNDCDLWFKRLLLITNHCKALQHNPDHRYKCWNQAQPNRHRSHLQKPHIFSHKLS